MRTHRLTYRITLALPIILALLIGGVVLFTGLPRGQAASTLAQSADTKSGHGADIIFAPRGQVEGKVYDVAEETPDETARILRRNKNRRYNRKDITMPLTELPRQLSGVGVHGEPPPSPFPVNECAVILVGTVLRGQPYLSESKSSIYTEFTIRVQNVLKSDNALSVGRNVVADREGGAIRLADGRVVRFVVGSQGTMPEGGNRYVFFLARTHQGEDLNILVAYELGNGKVAPLFVGQEHRGEDESAFLNRVRHLIAHPDQQETRKAGVQ